MTQYGIFNDESATYTEEDALEAGFYSREDAINCLIDNYSDDPEAGVHVVEEPEDEEETDENE